MFYITRKESRKLERLHPYMGCLQRSLTFSNCTYFRALYANRFIPLDNVRDIYVTICTCHCVMCSILLVCILTLYHFSLPSLSLPPYVSIALSFGIRPYLSLPPSLPPPPSSLPPSLPPLARSLPPSGPPSLPPSLLPSLPLSPPLSLYLSPLTLSLSLSPSLSLSLPLSPYLSLPLSLSLSPSLPPSLSLCLSLSLSLLFMSYSQISQPLHSMVVIILIYHTQFILRPPSLSRCSTHSSASPHPLRSTIHIPVSASHKSIVIVTSHSVSLSRHALKLSVVLSTYFLHELVVFIWVNGRIPTSCLP